MKVLVSTQKTQSQRSSDFCFVPDNELVKFGFECDRDYEVDGECGCRRSLVGVYTQKSTTTFRVSEWNGTKEEWACLVEESYFVDGFNKGLDNLKLLKIAEKYPIGTILEKRGEIIQKRHILIILSEFRGRAASL